MKCKIYTTIRTHEPNHTKALIYTYNCVDFDSTWVQGPKDPKVYTNMAKFANFELSYQGDTPYNSHVCTAYRTPHASP